MAGYMIGSGDPTIKPDKGAGKWKSEPWTVKMVSMKQVILNYIPHYYVVIGDDATNHLIHYFRNTGKNYEVDAADMLDDVPSAKNLYKIELDLAKSFVETLPAGEHQITSSKASGGYNRKDEDWNWFFAVGGYSAWGKGTATVTLNASGQRSYKLDFEYKIFDRYNWDKGKSVELFGVTITDQFMADFHKQGLAQEFNMNGSFKEMVTWGAPTNAHPTGRNGGGR